MIIQIDGTGTVNKGAELMLYAILEQIEKKKPNAKVIFNSLHKNTIDTQLTFKQPLPLKYSYYCQYIRALLFYLHIPDSWFTIFYPRKRIDIVLDASGFRHGDQWQHSDDYLRRLEKYYSKLKKYNTKIILLPQAFGPFKSLSGKKNVSILNKYVDLFIARERISKEFLMQAGCDKNKVLEFPDFTTLVKGEVPNTLDYLYDSVCIIPNQKMITHSNLQILDYINFVNEILELCRLHEKKIFLLNHESEGDFNICMEINKSINEKIPIVTGLNAKQVKGIIGQSYLVISSRFHGVANALNQSVPCLSTSWSHKYQLLFEDFELKDNIIDISSKKSEAIKKISNLLDFENNQLAREKLKIKSKEIKNNVEEMWNIIWEIINER
jgi:colanic acid/amylovoran biosynthesis protein